MIDMHHIITDGLSNQILTRDFTAFLEGTPLPPLALRYRDFSQWQNRLVSGSGIKAQETYWLNEFEGPVPVLRLPCDFPRPAVKRFEGSALGFTVGSRDAERLREMILKENVTFFMLLLSIYYILLFKITGQEDIVVGAAAAGRGRRQQQHSARPGTGQGY